MKKEIIICVIVIIFVLILNTMTESHTDFVLEEIEEKLTEIRNDLLDENYGDLDKKYDDTFEIWKEESEILAIYIEHDELEKIAMYLTETNSHIETEEYNMAVQSIDTCNFIMEHIKEKYKFSLKNIF